jgi:DNA-binding protein H-NS
LKKVLKDGGPFTGDFRETFHECYNKCFVPIKKKPNNDFVFFKYYTDDEKGDDEESEDSESDEESEDNETKDLLLKEIELMFENGYYFTDIKILFPSSFAVDTERINLLYTQVLEVRFNRDPILMVEKDIDVYKVRQDQIEIIEKRRTVKKVIKRKLKEIKKKMKTQTSIVTNGIRAKRILNLFSTTKSKKQNSKDQKRPRKFFRNTDNDSETPPPPTTAWPGSGSARVGQKAAALN